jgi:hypothetical protein
MSYEAFYSSCKAFDIFFNVLLGHLVFVNILCRKRKDFSSFLYLIDKNSGYVKFVFIIGSENLFTQMSSI